MWQYTMWWSEQTSDMAHVCGFLGICSDHLELLSHHQWTNFPCLYFVWHVSVQGCTFCSCIDTAHLGVRIPWKYFGEHEAIAKLAARPYPFPVWAVRKRIGKGKGRERWNRKKEEKWDDPGEERKDSGRQGREWEGKGRNGRARTGKLRGGDGKRGEGRQERGQESKKKGIKRRRGERRWEEKRERRG